MSDKKQPLSEEKLETLRSQISGIENLFQNIENLDKKQQIDALLGLPNRTKSKPKNEEANQPTPEPMKSAAFTALLNAMKEQNLPKDQLQILELAAFRNLFMSEQAVELLEQFRFSRHKLRALKAIRHRIFDPENHFMLLKAFTKSSEKKKASILLKNEENNDNLTL